MQTTFERITGGKLVEGYGLTETCSPTHINPINGTRKIGAIGVPVPNTLCKIVDSESGADLPVGKILRRTLRDEELAKRTNAP